MFEKFLGQGLVRRNCSVSVQYHCGIWSRGCISAHPVQSWGDCLGWGRCGVLICLQPSGCSVMLSEDEQVYLDPVLLFFCCGHSPFALRSSQSWETMR